MGSFGVFRTLTPVEVPSAWVRAGAAGVGLKLPKAYSRWFSRRVLLPAYAAPPAADQLRTLVGHPPEQFFRLPARPKLDQAEQE